LGVSRLNDIPKKVLTVLGNNWDEIYW
jgi:hypothetical protein